MKTSMKMFASGLCLLLLTVCTATVYGIGPYTNNGDGTVTDAGTGLTWQQQTGDVNNDGSITSDDYPTGDQATWEQALSYCENLNLAGHADWRLPNIKELDSIVDLTRYNPAINIDYFSCQSWAYWSATTDANYASIAWGIYFNYGYDHDTSKANTSYVRCVRGGLSGSFGYFGHLQQSPPEGPAGTTFTQSGTGFTPNSTVTLHFYDHSGQQSIPQQYATDGVGSFSVNYTSSPDKPVGTYTWYAVDDTTGKYSAKLSYRITESGGILSSLPIGPPPVVGPVHQNTKFGELTSEGNFNPDKDTFIIVHGWNSKPYLTSLPDWMTDMGKDIRNSNDSSARGSNVLYWNWLYKARTKADFSKFGDASNDESCSDVGKVPFDQTKFSGKYLARALKDTLPASYGKKIHFIGHSLGTLVVTYAAKYAYENDFYFKDKIQQIVYLDSPCYIGKPGKQFFHNHPNIFFDNYISIFGRGYADADTNVHLRTKAASWSARPDTPVDPHGYAHQWYRSSVTNFQNKDILHDSSTPSGTMPWGFYWWKETHQGSVEKDYRQKLTKPHYQLFSYLLPTIGGTVGGILLDGSHLLAAGSAMLREQVQDYVQWSENTVSILAVNAFNSAAAAAAVTTDTADHAVYNSLGFLGLIHSSTATMTIPVYIPPGATSLSFGYKFLYGSSDTMLEVFINDTPVYHTDGAIALDEEMQLVPWINVKEHAGSTINLNLRISNPEDGTEGKVRIDDLVIARITSGKKFPWPMFLPAINAHH